MKLLKFTILACATAFLAACGSGASETKTTTNNQETISTAQPVKKDTPTANPAKPPAPENH